MNGFEHLGELAELYALGALDARERDDVERHLARCAQCVRRLAEAERDVAVLAASQTQYAAPPTLESRLRRAVRPHAFPAWAAAVAAAFVVGFAPATYFWQQNEAMHALMTADSAALSRIATAPHRAVAFSPMPGGSNASVMYGPDGSWYVVVVAHVSKTLTVAWMHDGRQTVLGTAVPHGDLAMLYLPSSHRMDRLALMDGTAVVAEAQLAY
jgi:anti-sigma factor RsiW